MTNKDDLDSKIEKIRSIYQAKEKTSILITLQNNIAWLLPGRTFVNIAAIKGIAEIVVNQDGLFVVCNNVEGKRLAEEELPEGTKILTYDWFSTSSHDAIVRDLTENKYLTDSECEGEFRSLRTILTKNEQETFASLGSDCASAVQKTCFAVRKGMTEYQISGILAANCIERGIEPIVNLAAADERIFFYRHPLPTSKMFGSYLMLSICGRRLGQVVSLTRFVAIGELSTEILRKRDAVHNLEALLFQETRPNSNAREIFAKLIKGYDDEGYSDEWKLHHQGGLTGYDSREVKVNPETDLEIKEGQVFAWNPSITGFKSEDTILIGVEENSVLTHTDQFPSRSFVYRNQKFHRPDIFRL